MFRSSSRPALAATIAVGAVAALTACAVEPGSEAVGETTSSALISMPSATWTPSNLGTTTQGFASLAAGPGAVYGTAETTYAIPNSGTGAKQLWFTTNSSTWNLFPAQGPLGSLAQVTIDPTSGQLWVLTTAGGIYTWNQGESQWSPIVTGGALSEPSFSPGSSGDIATMISAGADGTLWVATNHANYFALPPGTTTWGQRVPTQQWQNNVSVSIVPAAIAAGSYGLLTLDGSGNIWYLSEAQAVHGSGVVVELITTFPGAKALAADVYGNIYTQAPDGVVCSYPWVPAAGQGWTNSGQSAPHFATLAAGPGGALLGAVGNSSSIEISSDVCPDEGIALACTTTTGGSVTSNCGNFYLCGRKRL